MGEQVSDDLIVQRFPGEAIRGGDLYQARRHGVFIGELHLVDGVVVLLETSEGFRRQGVASALVDAAVADGAVTYEADACQPDGIVFIEQFLRVRGPVLQVVRRDLADPPG